MLPVQDFLRSYSFGDLIKEHGVYASVSKDLKLVSLNYDIETKQEDELSWDCRGLILARSNHQSFETTNGKLNLDCVVGKTQVIAFGFRRFFNLGQGTAKIDWNDTKLAILSKEDGTLIQVYFCPITNEWNASTRSVPRADLIMDNNIFTFRTLFEKAVLETTKLTFEELTTFLNKEHTYCFELCSQINKIVVNYPTPQVFLLGVRDRTTSQEIDPAIFKDQLPVPQPRVYAPASMEDLATMVASWDPRVGEGVVARDSKFNRVKIKNPAHALYNKMRDSLYSERNIMELILLNKDDDVLGMDILPKEITDNIIQIKTGLQKVIKLHDEAYQELRQKAISKKDFALHMNDVKGLWQAPMFHRFDGKNIGIKDFIEQNRKLGTWGATFLDRLIDLSKNAAS